MSANPDLITLLAISVTAVLPTFAWVLSGFLLQKAVPRSELLFRRGDRLVFYVGMPLVLFFSAIKLDLRDIQNSTHLIAGTIAILVMVTGAYLYSACRGYALGHRGIVAQSAYRANMTIVGISLCVAAFGEQGLVIAALPIAVWTFLFNVIAAILLSLTHNASSSPGVVLQSIYRNPLILAIVFGLIVASFGISWPPIVNLMASIITKLTIPFALLCLGGGISLRSMQESKAELVDATILRLCISPLVAVMLCLALGVRGIELGVTFLLLGGPTAMASYVMVAAIGGNARLAANSVVLTTLLAPLTLTAGLFVLRFLELI